MSYCTWMRNTFHIIIVLWFTLSDMCSPEPKPATAPPNLYEETGNSIANVDSIHGSTAEKNSDESFVEKDWLPLPEALENARAQLADALSNILPDKLRAEAKIQENLEALRKTLPDLTQLPSDIEDITSQLSGWNWDKFIDEIMTSSSVAESMQDEIDDSNPPVECFMSMPEMIRHAGYECEVHNVETDDGYLLEVHRIPFGQNETRQTDRTKNKKRPVVFMQHGILSDSSCWVVNGQGRSLPFILADAGCDVWLGNVRGSKYSRKHITLNADVDEQYWRFSWQHMAQSDLPAMINKALEESQQSGLYYVGHSQGTLIAFAKLASDPTFNDKIRMMFALGPVSTLGHITCPIRALVTLATPVHYAMSLFGGAEILPNKPVSKWLSAQIHKLQQSSFNDTLEYHGSNLMLYLAGCHIDHYFADRTAVYLSHTPGGTSLQNLLHMGQLVESGKMLKFDFLSESENEMAYGQATPPEYDTSLIRTPVAMFVGSLDQLADPEDNKLLAKKLKNLIHYNVIEGWDHMDFLWGKEAISTVYSDVLRFITKQEQKNGETVDIPAMPSDEL